MKLDLLCVFVALGVVNCSEWLTSGGHHCIERCQESYRVSGSGNVEWSSVYTCPVVDGIK